MLATLLHLITVHQIDGRAVDINPGQIVSLAHPRPDGNRQFADQVKCLISFTDGKFLSVKETCDEVSKLIKDSN